MTAARLLVLLSALVFSGCQTKTAPQHYSNTGSTKERSSEWIWSENVEFMEYHDVMQIYLVDGRKLQVALGQSIPSAVEWSEVNQWKRGRALRIAFSATDAQRRKRARARCRRSHRCPVNRCFGGSVRDSIGANRQSEFLGAPGSILAFFPHHSGLFRGLSAALALTRSNSPRRSCR